MKSDSDDCMVVETKILPDKKWVESLEKEELEYFTKNQIPFEELEDRVVRCTACFNQGNHKQKGFFLRHPGLGVPICKDCHKFYFEGSWRKDDEGKFEYCGWCAQGGDLFCCTNDSCPNAFCLKCVKRNLGRTAVKKIEDSEEWKCFECEPKQVREQRLLFFSILAFWQKVDEKVKKKVEAKKAKEKAKNRSDCLTKTYQLATQCNLISKNFVTKNAENWAKNPNFSDKKVKEQSAEDFAKYLALSQKNLNQLKQRFLENVDEDLGASKKRSEKLSDIIEDLDSISNGHLEAIVVKKEKVKFAVLQNSSDEESTPKANGKKSKVQEEVQLSDTDELESSSEEEKDSDFDSDDIEKEERKRKQTAKKVKEELDKKFKKGKSKKEKEIEAKKRNPDEETPKKEKKSKEDPSSALKIKIGSKKVKKEENSSDEDFELTLAGTTNEPPVQEEIDSEDPKASKDSPDKIDSGVISEDSEDSPDKKDSKNESSDKNKAKKEVLADSSDEEGTKEVPADSSDEEAKSKKETPEKETPKKESPKKETPKKETPKKETPKKAEKSSEKKAKNEVLADSSDDEETQVKKDTTEVNGKAGSGAEEINSEDFKDPKDSKESKVAKDSLVESKKEEEKLPLFPSRAKEELSSESDSDTEAAKAVKRKAKAKESAFQAFKENSKKEKPSPASKKGKDSPDKNKAKKEVLADSSDEEDQASKKGKSKKETLKKAENSSEKKAKKDVLANSSDDEVKKEVLADSSDDEESSEDEELAPNSPEKKLREKFNTLISEIDVKSDKKINSKAEVEVQRLETEIEKKLKEGDNSIKIPEADKEETNKPRKKSVKKETVKFDEEINRLCDLGALKKLTKRTSRSKTASKKDKKDKMKNGKNGTSKKSVPESDIESLSSGDENGEVSIKKSPKKPMPKSKMAKEVVLATSESDLSETEGKSSAKKAKKAKSKEESDEKSGKSDQKKSTRSKSKSDDPKFMKVKLDETDSDAEEAKALKRREKAKKSVIADSDSDIEEIDASPKKERAKRGRKRKAKNSEDSGEDSDEGEDSDKKKEKPGKKGKKKRKSKNSDSEDFKEDSDEESDEDEKSEKNSDEDESDSDIGTKKKVAKGKKGKGKRGRKKKKSSSSSSGDLTDDEKRPKKKRKRIKKNKDGSGSDDEENASGSGSGDEKESPTKGGRKDIRKIIKDKKLSKSTKTAAQLETDRRKRVADKQALFNKLVEIKENAVVEALPLDIDPDSEEVLVTVAPSLCQKLKPHQARGIKFMFEAVFESKSQLEKGKKPGGAILAHCMGLGKTLQNITLIHTIMTNFPDHVKHVLVLAPVNTLKNWEEEFYKWLVDDLEDDINVHEISGEKDNWGRTDRLRYWRKNGGAMIMGYDMFRNLTNEKAKKFKKKQKEVFNECLVDPGPDLVICDEGHILKNTKSALNIAMMRIKTRRRIILTGTPLQNNLSEYFAMVDFVKPKLLGTFNEFRNRFVNPITNGQNLDSTERDVRVMKKRAFILNDLLKGCLQRLDYNVLVPFLQPKHEYVLCISLTTFQKKLYEHYLENFARAGQIGADGKLEGGRKGGLFYDVQNLSRVWNHPYILLKAKERADIKRMFADDAEEDEKFVNDDTESEAKSTESEPSNSDSEEEVIVKKRKVTTRKTREENKEDLVKGLDAAKADELASYKGWWAQFMKDPEDDQELLNVELGNKMVLLMDILKESYLIGDKVLVFSQSLLSLDLIEKFLSIAAYDDTYGTWNHGKDYFRMDGSTGPDVRKKWCSYFNNKKNNDMRLFLISTKAGGLGINLVAANRVIIFDASWNPAHDVQSIFRVYRFGQEKPVYVYRFLAKGTMEEKIYDRQVTKQSLSARVVDEQQIERHFTMNELAELYTYKDEPIEDQPIMKVPADKLLAELIIKHKDAIWKIHDHDSLLEHQVDQEISEAERKAAWEEYENEKKGISNMVNTTNLNMGVVMNQINPEVIRQQYRMQYPHLTEDQINQATRAYMMQIQSGFTGRVDYDRSHYAQEMAKARQVQQQMYPGMYNSVRGARPAQDVSQQDLAQQAKQLQILQRMAQLRRAQEIQQQQQQLQARAAQQNMARVTMNRPVATAQRAKPGQPVAQAQPRAAQPKPKPKDNKPPETIDLSDDDDEDDKDSDDEDDDSDIDEISEVPQEANGDADSDSEEEFMLDGAPETEDVEDERPSTSKRRGRPTTL